MNDREALAAALDYWDDPIDRLQLEPAERLIFDAARERLAQLPEKCGTCINKAVPGFVALGQTCPTCHGSGKVYPAERVFTVMNVGALPEHLAVAVLDALNGETR